MEELALPSYAKVNLVLDVRDRRPDGYHNICTIMVPVSLADRVRLQPAPQVSVESSPAVPGPPDANLAYRAACLLKKATGYPHGAAIRLEKVIPMAGGLAGGSSNAAAVLTGLNQLWRTNLSRAELMRLAIQLGSDVPFFIDARPARVEGIGEQVTPICALASVWMVLVTPAVVKSTGTVYRWLDELAQVHHPDPARMEQALAAGELEGIAAGLGNVFEQVMLPRHSAIGQVKQLLLEQGAIGALMSGAGPTVFGIMPDEAAARSVSARMAALGYRTWPVHMVSRS